ncbi:hypothetical protein pb186bvf_005769 [Paramecium bursaria]
MENQEVQPQTENPFDIQQMLPNLKKLLNWLFLASLFGMLAFPFLALTIDAQFSFHFWILTAINSGMLVTLLIFKEQMSKLDQKKE